MATATAKRAKVQVATPEEILAVANDVTTNVLVERASEMRVVTLGALAAKNIHLLGPPGTGKSLALREFCARITGSRFFYKAVHAQMPADALVGGYDMARYAKEGVFERSVEGYLPWADIPLVDEITRANGPTLDALLPLMNTGERLYEANGVMQRSNNKFFTSASNYMPEPDDAHLGALVDRLTLMLYIDYVQADDSFQELVRRDQSRRKPKQLTTITLEQFVSAQQQVTDVDATKPELLEAIAKLRRGAKAEGLRVSDRRWVELLDVARASAWLAGRDYCVPEDLAALEPGLWRDPSDRPIAHKLVLDFHNRFERHAAERRSEAEQHFEALTNLRPQVEGTPPSEPLDQEVTRAVTNAGRALKVVNQRVEKLLEEAKAEQSDAPAVRELHAELQAWRTWLEENDLPAKW